MFYVIKADGSSVSLEVHAMPSDEAASERALEVLGNHPGAEYVAVTRGLHQVATHRKDQPPRAKVPSAPAKAPETEPTPARAEDIEARMAAMEGLLSDLLRRDRALAQALLDAERSSEPASETTSRVSAARRRILTAILRDG